MTGKITCIVVEDEPLAMERMVTYIRKLPLLELLSTFEDAANAFTFLKSNSVDLIFLDINLGEMSGIQLLESMNIKADVIITTAYPDFALKGYDLANVTDYLLKPFSFERFLKAVDKVEQPKSKTDKEESFIFVKTENRLEKIELDDIVYIEGMRDYRRIHTNSKKIMTLQNFSEFEKMISPSIICRVHKSYMVSINKIESVEKTVIKLKEISIPVSETYKQQFYAIIGKA